MAVSMALTATMAIGAGCGGDDGDAGAGERAEQARQVATEAGLPPEVAQVLERAAGAAHATYRVTYDVTGQGGVDVVTVASDPPRRRVDTAAAGSDEARSFVSDGDGTIVCARRSGAWSCRAGESSEPVGVAPFHGDAVKGAIARLAAARDTHDFTVERRRMGGTTATCLLTTPKRERSSGSAPDSLCISPEGVPLLIERSAGTVRATSYTTEVGEDDLETPAEAT